jgi:two-component system, NarL family, response regulator YdfI
MSAPIRVVVADDHPVVREGLRMMLEEMAEGFEVVGEARDGETAVRVAGESQPDVVLMDLRMPGMGGLEAIQQIRQRWPQTAVLILTTYDEDDLMIRGLQAGAAGYLLKDCSSETVLKAIRTVARGELLAQPEVMARILSHAAAHVDALATPPGPTSVSVLTEREREILAAVAQGKRGKEIAAQLHIADRTVRAHLTNVYYKLGVDSRASAVAAALERGLLPWQRTRDEEQRSEKL